MKLRTRFWILGLLVLSSAFCGAETRIVTHSFNKMFYKDSPRTLTLTNENKTGTAADRVIYECSGGAVFSKNSYSGDSLAVFLTSSTAKVQISQIHNLDSLRIYYYPAADKSISVSYSTDGSSWTAATVRTPTNGIKTVRFPSVNDYYVRIARASDNVYVWRLVYCTIDLSDCPNCFIYKP